MEIRTCPNCDAHLVDTNVDKVTTKTLTSGTLTRITATRFLFACHAVVLQNDSFPEGTVEVPCGGPPVYGKSKTN